MHKIRLVLSKGHRTASMLSRQSKTCVRKRNKKPIIRFYPAIRLVNDHFKRGMEMECKVLTIFVFGRTERVVNVVDLS